MITFRFPNLFNKPIDLTLFIICSGKCTFTTYTPPEQYPEFLYPCQLRKEFIATCPDTYNDWALSEHCQTSPASFIYYKNKIYKNFYCAICHLGDHLNSAKIQPEFTYSRQNLSDAMPDIGQSNTRHRIRLSYDRMKCCGRCGGVNRDECVSIDGSRMWGSMFNPIGNDCMSAPFNTTCNSTSIELRHNTQYNLQYEYLCPGRPINCESNLPPGFKPIGSALGDGPDDEDYPEEPDEDNTAIGALFPSYATFNKRKFVKKFKINSIFEVVNESFQFCTDKSIRNSINNESFENIYLTPGTIQVK